MSAFFSNFNSNMTNPTANPLEGLSNLNDPYGFDKTTGKRKKDPYARAKEKWASPEYQKQMEPVVARNQAWLDKNRPGATADYYRQHGTITRPTPEQQAWRNSQPGWGQYENAYNKMTSPETREHWQKMLSPLLRPSPFGGK